MSMSQLYIGWCLESIENSHEGAERVIDTVSKKFLSLDSSASNLSWESNVEMVNEIQVLVLP